ncbi:MAG: hypothetical protein NVSMB64_16860 [Candidatus Velthaea sp.]
MRTIALAALALTLGLAMPAAAAQPAHAHRTIVSSSPAVQTQFNRGLTMLYAFNVGQARDDFRAAERGDVHCAMCYVGEALTNTIDINHPSTDEGERRGADAVARGRKAAVSAPEDERALLDALAVRFDLEKPLKRRYAGLFAAMQRYTELHPQDGFGYTQAAYAGWNATDDVNASDGGLNADGRTLAADLDEALKLDPDDLGARHLRIHFWEIAKHAERALPDADYLAGLTYEPGESHLPHMAGHTYARVGNYDALVLANEIALKNDEAYFKLGAGDGQKYMRSYHEHDVDFVLYGLSTVGRDAEARAWAVHESASDRINILVRLHANNEALRLLGTDSTPDRVIVEARLGDIPAAEKDLAAVRASGTFGNAANVAEAVLDRAKHDDAAALTIYSKLRKRLGDYPGDPKSLWAYAIGEGEGAVLLEGGKPDRAEAVFRRELAVYPNDPHLYFGLAEALKAQNKDDSDARKSYAYRWRGERPLTLADLG